MKSCPLREGGATNCFKSVFTLNRSRWAHFSVALQQYISSLQCVALLALTFMNLNNTDVLLLLSYHLVYHLHVFEKGGVGLTPPFENGCCGASKLGRQGADPEAQKEEMES